MSADRRAWRKFMVASLAAAAALHPQLALAHGAEAHGQLNLWHRWNFDALTLISLALLSGAYVAGLIRLWRSAGVARGVSRMNCIAFAAAILALIVALISPLDPASDELQSAHMIQHMLIMMVAAPLFVLGAPALVMLWALPRRWRHDVGAFLGRLGAWRPPWYLLWQPVLVCVLFAAALWVWHLPALYHAALRNRPVHEVQHISFFVVSCLFWRVLLDPLSRLRMNIAGGVVYLFLTSLHATLLGVFMALSPRVWYSDYIPRTSSWNLTPLEDQQLAGLIMWMPACMIYALVAAVIFALWVHRGELETAAAGERPVALLDGGK